MAIGPELIRISNESTRQAMTAIIEPVLDAGGDDSSVMVVLEGVVAGVLLAHNGRDARQAAAILKKGLVPGVIERMARAVKT